MGSQHIKDEGERRKAEGSSFIIQPSSFDLSEVRAALRDGAIALRKLAREVAFDNRRFVALSSRDEAATRAHKHYERLYQHAVMLTELANELALAPDVTPDEEHP